LIKCCCFGDYKPKLEKVKSILSKFPQLVNEALDKDGRTALFLGSWKNRLPVVTYLLERGDVDINKIGDEVVSVL
jgi:hypothetical protein